jgi:hypothetical protein
VIACLDYGITFFLSEKTLTQRENFFVQLFFSRQNVFLLRKIFLFQNTRKHFGGKKITEQKSFLADYVKNKSFCDLNFNFFGMLSLRDCWSFKGKFIISFNHYQI